MLGEILDFYLVVWFCQLYVCFDETVGHFETGGTNLRAKPQLFHVGYAGGARHEGRVRSCTNVLSLTFAYPGIVPVLFG